MRKVALITGSATGIGAATARELAGCGYDIVINYCHSEKEAFSLCAQIEKDCGVNCLVIQADVSKEDEVEQMVSKIIQRFGRIDVLVNNAGIDLPNLFQFKTAEEFRRVLDVNLVGAYNCAKSVFPSMKQQEYGRIINITSTNGINSYFPMCFDYDASKTALISLTHNLAVQYSPYVHVNAIAPGFIGTDKELDGYDEEFLKEETEKIMAKRYGRPEEVAYLVKFLVSNEADFINNTVIRIDGGQMGSV